ncbi:MAG: acyl-CoA carboxylase subunit beta, partial [Candidatus Kapaibacterium sp.]
MSRTIGSAVEHDLTFETNYDFNKELYRKIRAVADITYRGGGAKAIERHHAKGKLTARERIAKLVDADSEILEVGLFCAHDMYAEQGGAPGAGVVVVIGVV